MVAALQPYSALVLSDSGNKTILKGRALGAVPDHPVCMEGEML